MKEYSATHYLVDFAFNSTSASTSTARRLSCGRSCGTRRGAVRHRIGAGVPGRTVDVGERLGDAQGDQARNGRIRGWGSHRRGQHSGWARSLVQMVLQF